MTAWAELRRLQDCSSKLHALKRSGGLASADADDMLDEIEVLQMHADSRPVRKACASTLREFRGAQALSRAHG